VTWQGTLDRNNPDQMQRFHTYTKDAHEPTESANVPQGTPPGGEEALTSVRETTRRRVDPAPALPCRIDPRPLDRLLGCPALRVARRLCDFPEWGAYVRRR
jgi:hypothetical protein